jgi:hypothetical protein
MTYDSGAGLADRADAMYKRNSAQRTAQIWMRICAIAGTAAVVSGYVDGARVELWIVAGLCFGVGAVIGIATLVKK